MSMIKLGLCGTNNSHAVVFSRLANTEAKSDAERVEGARVVAFFAYDDENVDELLRLGLRQVQKPGDLIGLVDGVLCVTRDGSKHLGEAVPFLEAGLPTFVDKPLAISLKDATEIVSASKRYQTPLMSCSALRFAPEITSKRKRFEEISPLRAGTVTGMGETIFYGVHAAEMMSTVFGSGVDWVTNLGNQGHDMGVVRYRDGKTVCLQILRDAKTDFRLTAHGENGWEQVVVQSSLYYPETLKQIIKFVETGVSPVPVEDTLEIIAVLNAMVESREKQRAIRIRNHVCD